jgi:hypothetical protein
MRVIFSIISFILILTSIRGQESYPGRCPYKGPQITDNRIVKEALDFTITTTDGVTRNLYNTLDSGKTVFVDLFYTTCSWCQYYSPIIEQVYQDHGAGQGGIEFWGISNNLFDPDSVIDAYKEAHNITNPCGGPDGGGTTAHTRVISGQDFQGWPTYVVICPNHTMYFDPCYPPTIDGFDPYFEQCAEPFGISDNPQNLNKTGIITMYPVPAEKYLTVELNSTLSGTITLEVFDLMGIKVMSKSFENKQHLQTYTLSVADLQQGTYFLRMVQDEQIIDTRKLLIFGK